MKTGKVNISENQLRELVREALIKKYNLQEASDWTAPGRLSHIAEGWLLTFQETLVKELGLETPDKMDEEHRKAYDLIIDVLKQKLLAAVKEAMSHLSTLQKKQEEPTL